MKLKIEIPTNTLLVSVDDAGPFITNLSKMQAIRETGWGKDAKIEISEERIKVEVVADDIGAAKPEPLKKALENYETAQRNWLDEYGKRQAAEKKAKELQEKLDKVAGVATNPQHEQPTS